MVRAAAQGCGGSGFPVTGAPTQPPQAAGPSQYVLWRRCRPGCTDRHLPPRCRTAANAGGDMSDVP